MPLPKRLLPALLLAAALAAVAAAAALQAGALDDGSGSAGLEDRPMAVLAHVDTGVNPYHEVFEDDSPLAREHPSTYIEGYPEDAERLDLHLEDDLTYREAFLKDVEEGDWNLTEGQLYWIPGTKIVGAVSFGDGGVFCPLVEAPPANGEEDPRREDEERCREHEILDDFGHGTMTATRAAGNQGSLCPDCRIVTVEGLGTGNVRWAAEQGWIDVQTNSWGFLTPDPVFAAEDEAGDGSARENVSYAAQRHLTYFASGNGAAGFFGFTPWPTHVQPTHQDGIVSVGAHDNGRVAHWQGTPPHVVADGFRPLAAASDSRTAFGPLPMSCCTSAAAPYAAGEGARLVLEARRILDDTSVGHEDGVLAQGDEDAVHRGPLADGDLTLDEARRLVKHTAQPRPVEGRHDGAAHWLGDPAEKRPNATPWGPGDNAFCPGCWTLPAQWKDVPQGSPTYANVGYGAVNEYSLQAALAVLHGATTMPDRPDTDRYFAAQEPVREAIHRPEDIASASP